MEKIFRTWASMFALTLLFLLGAGVQNVSAQDLEDGYYYLNTTVSDYSGQGMKYVNDSYAWRVKAVEHSYGKQVTPEDVPFVFKFMKQDDGTYYVQNYTSGLYWGRGNTSTLGAGFGLFSTPEPFTVTNYNGGYQYVFDYAVTDNYPSTGGVVHAQSDGYVGFWGDASNIYAHKVWEVVPVDTASLFNPQDVVEVEGSTDDGYYYINIPGADDATTCMVPVRDGEIWRLGAYPRDDSDFDASYVWHITKNADSTYNIKNCGAQDLTYVEVVTKGGKESPYVLMTGTKPGTFKFQYMSDGTVYIFATDNDYNLGLNSSDGNIRT